MDSFAGFRGSTPHALNFDQAATSGRGGGDAILIEKPSNQKGYEDKKAAVHEEMSRISKLPSNSTYAIHRSRVLNKILHLLSIQRTASQEEELELLFAGLSI